MVQVIVYVPAFAKVTAFVSPALIVRPADALNAGGAPGSGVRLPLEPTTRICRPPVAAGSLNVTAWPALMVTLPLFGWKLTASILTVAGPVALPPALPWALPTAPQPARTKKAIAASGRMSFFMGHSDLS